MAEYIANSIYCDEATTNMASPDVKGADDFALDKFGVMAADDELPVAKLYNTIFGALKDKIRDKSSACLLACAQSLLAKKPKYGNVTTLKTVIELDPEQLQCLPPLSALADMGGLATAWLVNGLENVRRSGFVKIPYGGFPMLIGNACQHNIVVMFNNPFSMGYDGSLTDFTSYIDGLDQDYM